MKWILGLSILGLSAGASPDPSWMYVKADTPEQMRREDFNQCHKDAKNFALIGFGEVKEIAANRCMTKLGYTQTMWSR